ncbi:transglutaminase family protein [Skermanella sp. TT6]|uniref:Transglutaminase family protein n=1 Tax=Skermanella cutis TaxID=2775420 RepID=A0ABX7B944_9PROT|nr:transglutaminase family protein [Skermanella sp. TT6]QQP89596.1 transglutaminase family protein [Skermanella sp. TT6]
MKYSVSCKLGYDVEEETVCFFNLQPAQFDRQVILDEHLDLDGGREVDRFTMGESGNRFFKVVAPPGKLMVRYRAEVDLDPLVEDPAGVGQVAPIDLPLDVLPHLNPSRFCQSDRLRAFAFRQFGEFAPGHQRVTAICNWIHDNLEYLPGSSHGTTSAVDTIIDHAGVCRDFAHLGITLCRAMDIPARYVSAYAFRLDPPDFHATFEAFLGGRWYLFDATRKAALDGLIRIGVGRDAAEVSFSSFFGKAKPDEMEVAISSPDRAADGPLTTDAVSLSER